MRCDHAPVCLALWAAAAPAAAATLTVDRFGSGDYLAIQDAIDAASSGDTIEVSAATYNENIDFAGKDLTVRSVSGSASTTIHGSGADPTVTFAGGESSAAVLDGFEITHGTGRGLEVSGSSPTLDDLSFTGLYGTNGGAVLIENGSPTFSDAAFTDNTADDEGAHVHISGTSTVEISNASFSGGVSSRGGIYAGSGVTLTLLDTTFSAPGPYAGTFYVGSAVYTVDADVYTERLVVEGGQDGPPVFISLAAGGVFDDLDSVYQDNEEGALQLEGQGVATLDGTSFLRNDPFVSHGVVYLTSASGGCGLDLVDTWFEGNTGNALELEDCANTITTSTFVDNLGRAAHNQGHLLSVTDSTFRGNTVSTTGAAIISGYGGLFVTGSIFEDNTAGTNGGAIVTSSGTIEDTVFSGNTAGDDGGAIYLSSSSASVELVDVTMQDNEAGRYGDGIGTPSSSSSVTVTGGAYSDFFYLRTDTVTVSGAAFEEDGFQATGTDLVVEDSTFTNLQQRGFGCFSCSTVSVSGSTFSGSGSSAAYVSGADSVSFIGNRFEDNEGLVGSAISVVDSAPGAPTAAAVVIKNNRFCGNHATHYDGGAVSVDNEFSDATYDSLELVGNIFVGNTSDSGASDLAFEVPRATVLNNLFLGGQGAEAAVVGTAASAGSSGSFMNNVVAYTSTGVGVSAESAVASGVDLYFNDWYSNAAGDVGGSLSAGLVSGSGNLTAVPDFVSWTGDCDDDLWLASTSSLIDAGDPAITDPDGSRSDIGAYGGTDPYALDSDGDGWWDDEDCEPTDASAYPGGTETWYDGIDGDCDGADDFDQDLDGYQHGGAGPDDCDDLDPSVHPGAPDTWYDGVDQDCSGGSDLDRDGDGHDSDTYGGDDCDDLDGSVHPGATDVPEDGVDQDCDGADATGGGGDDTGGGGDDTGDGGDDTGDGADDTGSGDDGGADGGGADGGGADGGGADDGGKSGCSTAGPAAPLLAGVAVGVLGLLGRRRRRR